MLFKIQGSHSFNSIWTSKKTPVKLRLFNFPIRITVIAAQRLNFGIEKSLMKVVDSTAKSYLDNSI